MFNKQHPLFLWAVCFYSALAGLAWGHLPGIWATVTALLLPVLIPQLPLASGRFIAALTYFLVGSFSIVHGSAEFFGAGAGNDGGLANGMGWSFWIVSSILLSLPWLIARNPTLSVLAVLIDALPPLGLIGWLSPLAGAGVLFPDMGVYGLALLLVIWGLWSVQRWGKWIAVGSLAVTLVANTIAVSPLCRAQPPPPVIDGWVGLQTHTGELVTPLQGVESTMQAGQMALAHPKAAVVVFPETIVGHWLSGTQAALFNKYQQRQNKQQIWLIGAVTFWKTHRWDSVVEYAPGVGPVGHIVARTAFPVPVSMWAPWAKDRYGATWYTPARKIGGQRVYVSICYDQALSWVWLEAVWQRPAVIVATSNVWWASKTDIPAIEDENTDAWARLMGDGVVRARNG